ncbi:hypothetical protein [Aquimarina longa]|uniref:hypothetical protein n=1 Tax=Aquimarina longa TaxID=1080221 RepID=UPI0011E01D26|nr:hypothetical protein [Aquimarina longa]
MKIKFIMYAGFIFLFFITSCKEINKKANATTNHKKSEQVHEKSEDKVEIKSSYNFDNIIKCEKYGYDGTASIADYGCLYNPKGNNTYGNIAPYLIPKIGIKKHLQKVDELFKEGDKYDKWEKEGERINSLSVSDIKEEFYIYLSLIDKKYLEHTSNLDASYNIKRSEEKDYKFTTQWFTFNNSIKSWQLLNSFETSPSTDRKAWEWEQEKIKEVIAKNQ